MRPYVAGSLFSCLLSLAGLSIALTTESTLVGGCCGLTLGVVGFIGGALIAGED